MITGVSTVTIYVDDQQKSLKFWTEKLGFEVRANHEMGKQGKWIEVAPGGGQTSIVLYPKSMMPNWNELKPSIIFQCKEIGKTIDELKSKGVSFIEEPKGMAWGTYTKFVDADGYEYLIKE